MVEDETSEWSLLGVSYTASIHTLAMKEYSDGFIHSVKGTIGLSENETSNVEFENIEIFNEQEQGDLAIDKHGNYESSHFNQQLPYQFGYTGRIQGAVFSFSNVSLDKDILVDSIQPYTVASCGATLWGGTEITKKHDANMLVSNIVISSTIDNHDNQVIYSNMTCLRCLTYNCFDYVAYNQSLHHILGHEFDCCDDYVVQRNFAVFGSVFQDVCSTYAYV